MSQILNKIQQTQLADMKIIIDEHISAIKRLIQENFEYFVKQEPHKWIAVEDDLPAYDESVWWFTENGHCFYACINDFEKFQSYYKDIKGIVIKITHWQSVILPTPPTK
jgi:Protein of unknown function (DUF551)